jgi:hypothetical protein
MFEIYQEESPLAYVKSNDVHRFGIWSPELANVPFKSKDFYFAPTETKVHRNPATGRKYKVPHIEIVPGSRPGTIGFVDWHTYGDASDRGVYIDYMKVRSDWLRTGSGKAMVEAFYRTVMPGMTSVHWGKIMSPYAWKIYQHMKIAYPNIHHSGHVDF